MPTPHNVPAQQFITQLTKYIKDNIDAVQPPPWAPMVKTSSTAQRQPENPEWWYTRAASILRKIYLYEPIGTQHLRADYGGRTGKKVSREHVRKGAGTNIRKIMQQLETAGLIEKTPKGRTITKEGRKTLDRLAAQIQEELEKQDPRLKKYP
jgi:small subunit ribosomal protein S19e